MTVRTLVDLVDRADVRVIQSRHRPGLTLEAVLRVSIVEQILGQELDRDLTVQIGVIGNVNRRHAALADALQDLVAPVLLSLMILHRPRGRLYQR